MWSHEEESYEKRSLCKTLEMLGLTQCLAVWNVQVEQVEYKTNEVFMEFNKKILSLVR